MRELLLTVIAKLIGGYINLLSYIKPQKALSLAYRYFSGPRAGKLIQNKLPGILKEAKAEMVTINNNIFQMYTWAGMPGKETVLLVHGWESNASRWKLLISYLKKSGCTIIALDAPAHGLSSGTEFSIPLYAKFVDYIVKQCRPFAMVGHSLGGITALYYQATYKQDIIKKLIVMGAPCDFNMILKNFTRNLRLNSKIRTLMKKHLANVYGMEPDLFCGDTFASEIKIEGLLIHDNKDKTVPLKDAKKIAEAWPDAEFLITKGLGHSMHDDAMYRKIYSFIFTKHKSIT
ncbi:alpha/beta fold hydrolase [Flavobacterium rhizosphaerae]|uniref:Alpha/beta hydrolase n=1 Tax=Flavobacterium rhizosphaerae TaxID=3163298 RepID=A0ABW8Z0Q4_9FLAO